MAKGDRVAVETVALAARADTQAASSVAAGDLPVRVLLGISISWIGLSLLTDGVTTLVAPFRADRLVDGSEATLLGLTTFAGLIVAMALQPIAGQWSDGVRGRWGRRGAVALGLAGAILGLVAFGLLASPVGFVVSYIAIQAAASVAQAGQQGYIPDLVPPGRRGIAAGWKGLMDVGGATIAFALMGTLLSEAGLLPALGAGAVVIVVLYLVGVLLVDEPPGEGGPTVGPTISRAYRLDLQDDGRFVRIVAARFAFLLSIFGVGRFFVLFVEERLALTAREAVGVSGGLLAALALVTAAVAIPSGWLADRWGRVRVMRAGVGAAFVGVAGLAVATSTWQILLFGVAMALGSAAFSAANWAAAADAAQPRDAGRLMGIANFGTAGAAACAGLFGPLVDAGNAARDGFGFGVLFAMALLSLGACLFALRKVHEREELPT